MAIYLDTSAAVKLVVPEAESPSLFAFLSERSERVSSEIIGVEVTRALRRDPLQRLYWRERAKSLLETLTLLPVDAAVLARAGNLNPPELRSLDAIHLATALSMPGLEGMVVYDRRLARAAEAAGLRVWAPA